MGRGRPRKQSPEKPVVEEVVENYDNDNEVEKVKVDSILKKGDNPNIAQVRIRRIGVDEVTGEPLFKPFVCTFNYQDYKTFLKLGGLRISNGKKIGVFNSHLILEEVYLPDGFPSYEEWKQSKGIV